ncbi:hypothetical protein MAPG_09649 [Magnaporthiopsis poae ATCC 64411]|uniref:Uncharacterized protein n=1 Tax=Magnaporthiopsis poae (strain ATCC 64411 / 73-15) TaxID=644358 RepID=A0A0C4EAH8_MAGP6|nr:hypothetical protein MAPG_09649 [Magnaporthiopsis poae ATCC 64411]
MSPLDDSGGKKYSAANLELQLETGVCDDRPGLRVNANSELTCSQGFGHFAGDWATIYAGPLQASSKLGTGSQGCGRLAVVRLDPFCSPRHHSACQSGPAGAPQHVLAAAFGRGYLRGAAHSYYI